MEGHRIKQNGSWLDSTLLSCLWWSKDVWLLVLPAGTTYIRGLLPTIGDVNSRRSPFKKVRRMRKTINRILSMKGLHSNFGSCFAGGGGGRVQCPQEAPWAEQRGACLQDGFWGGCRNVSPSSQGAECWSCRGELESRRRAKMREGRSCSITEQFSAWPRAHLFTLIQSANIDWNVCYAPGPGLASGHGWVKQPTFGRAYGWRKPL